MDFQVLTGFNPRIIDVVEREEEFWRSMQYVLYRKKTVLNVLALVYRGQGMYETNRLSRPLRPGCVFQVVPGSTMKITTALDRPLCFFSIHFDYGIVHWDGATGVWHNGPLGALPFGDVMLLDEWAALSNAFQHLFHVWNQKHIGYEWFTKVGFLDILAQLTQQELLPTQETSGPPAVIQRSIKYIQSHLQEDLSRDLLARKASLSPSYFSILFKKYAGYSPTEYVTKVRIDRAKDLLRSSRLPIRGIASEVGFTDSFYFTRVFTKEVGMSPRDYRQV